MRNKTNGTYLIVEIDGLPYEIDVVIGVHPVDVAPNDVLLDLSPAWLGLHGFLDDVVPIAVDYAVHLVVEIRLLLLRLLLNVVQKRQLIVVCPRLWLIALL